MWITQNKVRNATNNVYITFPVCNFVLIVFVWEFLFVWQKRLLIYVFYYDLIKWFVHIQIHCHWFQVKTVSHLENVSNKFIKVSQSNQHPQPLLHLRMILSFLIQIVLSIMHQTFSVWHTEYNIVNKVWSWNDKEKLLFLAFVQN